MATYTPDVERLLGTKTVVTTQVINGQPVVKRETVVASEADNGKYYRPTTPTSDALLGLGNTAETIVTNTANVLGGFTSFVDWIVENWKLAILGGLALIILIKRL